MTLKKQLNQWLELYAATLSREENLDEFKKCVQTIRKFEQKNLNYQERPYFPGHSKSYLYKLASFKQSSEKLSNMTIELANKLGWYKIIEGFDLDKNLANGLFATQLCGPRGLIKSNDIYFGLFLLAPNILYPLHQHDAVELYCVCSGELKINHGRTSRPEKLRQGSFSLTPSKQVHSLRTGTNPCLLSYVWLGENEKLPGNSWWWQEEDNGSWVRISWERNTDSSWRVSGKESLTDSLFKEAGDN